MEAVQSRIREFCKKHDLDASPEHRMLDAVSEFGEVAKELLKMSSYGRREPVFREEIRSELGDVLFSLIALANSLDVNLADALDAVLFKYEKRLVKGSAGSEND